SCFTSVSTATFLKPFPSANFDITVPWNGSMKQMRKMKSPTSVTFGFVDAGEIIGTLFCWQIGAASSDFDDATSPSRATISSCEMARKDMASRAMEVFRKDERRMIDRG